MRTSKVPNDELRRAGLRLMEQNGKPLQRIEAKGRAMIYKTADRETVRVRTCNDHVLIAVAESPEEGARLNIEGTERILVVMPEVPRSRGPVIAFFIPTSVAVAEVRSAHREWLASNPSTKGKNRTWNIWFDDDAPSEASGYARKWAEYRLNGSSTTQNSLERRVQSRTGTATRLGEVITEAKRRIAEVADVPESAVRITIDLA
jgi:hypothetical protein